MADLISMLAGASGIGAEEADPNFNQTVLLLHGDGTNGAQNNTFLDGSTNNFTITRNGNTTQGTFSPFSGPNGYWSNYFDGTNDRLTIADDVALRPGTSAFTIEAWVYRAAAGAAHTIFAKGASTPTGFAFLITSSDTLRFTDTSTDITSTGTVAANTWVHVAAVREGTGSNQLKLYINGVQDGTGTSSSDFTQTEEARIGENRGATDDFNGYISNFRYVIGTALYTTAFTPSTSPLTTTSQGATSSQVELLTCQSNRFLDNSTNSFTVTPVNNARVTPFSPFAPSAAYSASTNGGSGYFDGNGDWLEIADNAAFEFGSGEFSVELFIYFNNISSLHAVIEKNGGTYPSGFEWQFITDSTGVIQFNSYTTGLVTTGSAAGGVTVGQWMHIVGCRSGTTQSLFINGTRVATTTNSGTIQATNSKVAIGRSFEGVTTRFTNGYISSLRILKGSSAYDATQTTLTVPTAPVTTITNTQLLCNFTNAGIFDNTGKNNLETVGNAQIDTAVKKFGTGSLEFDGSGDWLVVPNSPELNIGTGDFTIECWVNRTAAASGASNADAFISKGTNNFICNFEVNTGKFRFAQYGVANLLTSTTVVSNGTWYHYAITRSGTSLRMFINGTQEASTTNSANFTSTTNMFVGADANNTNQRLNGYIDDLRITKGVARYTANFTPPTAAFPNE